MHSAAAFIWTSKTSNPNFPHVSTYISDIMPLVFFLTYSLFLAEDRLSLCIFCMFHTSRRGTIKNCTIA